ncbi:hypothetical protein RA210_U160040 [Rubrivivax sp. A210]|nr:hypothetical protein RA210_U160040 [Rubrivivax sp. A210]
MQALNAPLEARLVERLLQMVGLAFADSCARLGEAGTRRQVEQAIARADAWGMVTEQQTAFVVWLLFRWGAAFDTEPRLAALRELLQVAGVSGDEKLALATRRLAADGLA